MDRDALYYHFANLGLVLIGLFSIQTILSPLAAMILIPGTIAGFIVSWQIRDSRPQQVDTFIGMLSLAAVVIVLGGLYDTAITFDNLLRIFSTALIWLTLFQSFGLKTGKSYAILQIISVCLFVSSVGLVLENETFYVTLLALFLFVFIFTMRLNLVCEKKSKGSLIFGDREETMSLWQQIKVGALMFFFIFITASIVYPFVPRFESLSLRWIPSSLLGVLEQVPLLKLTQEAPKTVKDDDTVKEEQLVDDNTPKRETAKGHPRESNLEEESSARFPAKRFDKTIDMFKVASLNISADKKDVPLDSQCKLEAELRMKDGSVIPATHLVDWKVKGTGEASINGSGAFIPKKQGYVYVSASYMGDFSNDLRIEVTGPVAPIKKKGWPYYLFVSLFWFLIFGAASLAAWIFIKTRKLSGLALSAPREFIKEIYVSLCRAFRPYGVFKFNSMAPREFFDIAKDLVVSRPEPMRDMTEIVLEARFSDHEISEEHSWKTLGLFYEVKNVVLERDEGRNFWKKILFTLLLLDVLLVQKQD